jgi:hypothetical protein
MSDVSIDVGSALPFLWNQFLGLIGRDPATTEFRLELETRIRTALREAASIQVIGMDRPLALRDVYQPTRVVGMRTDASEDFEQLVEKGRDTIIFGLPGYGKTTLLRHTFARLTSQGRNFAILYTLRRPGAVQELVRFVRRLSTDAGLAKTLRKKGALVFLIDGFDEIVSDDRKDLIEALKLFQSLELGSFHLTARMFYEIGDLNALHIRIAPFNDADVIHFIRAFATGYGHDIDAGSLLHELKTHGFHDFATHPLLLALACIVRTGPNPILPRTTIGLIKRAVATLTLRWDASKQIDRPTKIPVDGEGRIECMMRIAYDMQSLSASDHAVVRITREYLALSQHKNVEPNLLLLEMAQWYGLLVPVDNDHWAFVHKTIHDYLAARHWVESGEFAPHQVTEWDACAAYAACLSHNATGAIVAMLTVSGSLYAFSECLYNAASFHVTHVATALIRYFRLHGGYQLSVKGGVSDAKMQTDVFALASDDFIVALTEGGANELNHPGDIVLAFALAEACKRGISVPNSIVHAARGRLGERVRVQSETRSAESFLLSDLKIASQPSLAEA